MDQLRWIVQLAVASIAVIALFDQGRKNGWI
jgi:hypothetical protein